jgi:thiamine kinase
MRLSQLPRPGADAAQELRSQRAAAAAGLAPAVIDAAPDASWVLMRYVEGAMWTREALADPARLEALGTRLALVHGLSPLDIPPLDVRSIVQGQVAAIRARGRCEVARLDHLAAAAEDLADRIEAEAVVPVLNHGDLNVANLLGQQPTLVDWEYAQRADPVYDLACLFAYYPELQSQQDLLLGAAGLDGSDCRRRLHTHAALFAIFNTLWSLAQGDDHGDAAGLVPVRPAE